MKHEMPKLPHSSDALAPRMSRETLDYHYGKHLATFPAKNLFSKKAR